MDFVFPFNLTCIFCSQPISKNNKYSLCKSCYYQLSFLSETCPKCGRIGENIHLCTFCYGEKYYFDEVISVLEYNDFIHPHIHSYKYGHRPYMARYFSEIMKDYLEDNNRRFDFITGVPISKKRMNQRGFNQTYLIAENLRDFGDYVEIFQRTRSTRFLSKMSRAERNRELDGAFVIKEDTLDYMMNKIYVTDEKDVEIQLCIIDDIFTTGTTANELSKLIKKNIANTKITVLTLCNARIIKKDKQKP